VEVNGQKGTICADNWTLTEAKVACKQLGKHYASRAYKVRSFGILGWSNQARRCRIWSGHWWTQLSQ
jgi:hypothetical protein